MMKGLVFVWAPKELVSELLTIMEKKDFIYVQNLKLKDSISEFLTIKTSSSSFILAYNFLFSS